MTVDPQDIADLQFQMRRLTSAFDAMQVELAANRIAISEASQKATRAVNALITMRKLKP